MLADEPIHFALLMPFSGSWDIGRRIAGAAELAVERVNANKALLPGRWLEYDWANSGCSPQKGLEAMGELLGRASKVSVVIGPGCSSACEVTSYLAGGEKIPQISWGCASPKLSNKDQYRLVTLPRPSHSLGVLNVLDCNVIIWLGCSSLEQQRPTPAEGQR